MVNILVYNLKILICLICLINLMHDTFTLHAKAKGYCYHLSAVDFYRFNHCTNFAHSTFKFCLFLCKKKKDQRTEFD